MCGWVGVDDEVGGKESEREREGDQAGAAQTDSRSLLLDVHWQVKEPFGESKRRIDMLERDRVIDERTKERKKEGGYSNRNQQQGEEQV